MKKILLILFLLLSLKLSSFANNEIDSLENYLLNVKDSSRTTALNNLAAAYLFISPQRSLQLSWEALDLAKKYKIQDEEGRAYHNLGATYIVVNLNDSALHYLPLAYQIFENNKDSLRMANVQRAMGDAYGNITNYSKAQESYYNSFRIFERLMSSYKSNPQIIKLYTILLNNFGTFYYELENYPESIKYFEKALEAYIKQNRKQGQSIANYNIANSYEKLNNQDQALSYYNRAITIAKEINNTTVLANSLQGMGAIYIKRKEFDKAITFLLKAEPLVQSIEDNAGLYHLYANLGSVYFETKKFAQSLKNYKDALKFAEVCNSKLFIIDTYKNLSDVYSRLGDYKESYNYLQKFIQFKDSANLVEKNKKIAELDEKFRSEKQAKEVQDLKNQNNINELQKSRLTSVIISLVLIIALISFLAYELYKRNIERAQLNELLAEKHTQIEQKNNELVESNATKDKFFSIIAHDLRNPLGSFKELSEMLSENYDDFSNEEKIEFIKSLSSSSKTLFNLLDNLLDWSRAQRGTIEFAPENLPIRMLMDYYLQSFKEPAKTKAIKLEISIPEELSIFADQYLISTVIKNLVSNAIKYTNFGGKVKVTAIDKTLYTEFTVADNGIGISSVRLAKLFKIDEKIATLGTENEAGTGLGLILCKEFIGKHNGEIWIESEENGGTTVHFNIPKV